jgi:phosphate/sulfate permease
MPSFYSLRGHFANALEFGSGATSLTPMPETAEPRVLDYHPTPPKPSHERFLLIAFLLLACIFSAVPIRNQIHKMRQGEDGTKDYPLWYDTGRRELHGISPYYEDRNGEFPFMYPPGAAGLLAPLSLIGKLPMVTFLVLLNSLAWATCILGPIYLLSGRVRGQPAILYWLPSLVCIFFIWDTYLEGQMAFCLSACLIGMLICLKQGRQRSAGALLAIAAGFKAFPILAFPYLVYRRQWLAIAYTMLFLVVLLADLPAIFRGREGALVDLFTWQDGMLAPNTAAKMTPHGRGERSYTWQNGSVMSVTHRWLRHVKADTDQSPDEKPLPPVYINIADLPLKTVNHIADAILVLLGIGYVFVTPRERNRTAFTDAAEGAMLLILVILASPMSFTYNNSWLMCGIATVLYFITNQPGESQPRRRAVIWLTCALLPLALSVSTGIYWWRYVRTMGNTLLADILMLALLGWLCRRHANPQL